MEEILKRFGQKIRSLRKARGMSATELADLLGVAKQTVSNWERGVSPPMITTFIRMCTVLDATASDLLEPDTIALPKADITFVRSAASATVVPLRNMTEGASMIAGELPMTEPKTFVPSHFPHKRKAFAFAVNDRLARSMSPKFRLDDIVIVDPDADVEPGKYVLAKVGSEIVFRCYSPATYNNHVGAILSATSVGWPSVIMGADDIVLAVMTESSTAHHY